MKTIQSILAQMTPCGTPTARPTVDIFSNTYKDTSQDPITLKHDALALSCCSWRMRNTGLGDYWNIQSDEVGAQITQADIDLANEIRSFYGKKILWLQLNGRPVSQFRKDLMKYIHSDARVVTEHISGMIHKMPDFYEEDKILNQLKALADTSEFTEYLPNDAHVVLTPLRIILRRSKHTKINNYWLLTADKRLCQIEIPQPNPLEPLWLDIFNNCATITISGRFIPGRREDFNFYRVTNWKVEK